MGNINQHENPIKINITLKIKVFANCFCFSRVNFKPSINKETTTAKAMIVPELKGKPIEFTKNISDLPKKVIVNGSKNINTTNKTPTTITLAKMKFFIVTSGYFLK